MQNKRIHATNPKSKDEQQKRKRKQTKKGHMAFAHEFFFKEKCPNELDVKLRQSDAPTVSYCDTLIELTQDRSVEAVAPGTDEIDDDHIEYCSSTGY